MNNSLNLISPDEYKELIKSDDITILDTRDSDDFVKYHLPNSIFIGLNGRFAPWVGEILKDVNTQIIFVCRSGKEKEVVMRLARIGFDKCIGSVSYTHLRAHET